MNIMKDISILLGLDWDTANDQSEEFEIEGREGYLYKITANGLTQSYKGETYFYSGYLEELCSGKRNIIKLPWTPKIRESYFYANISSYIVGHSIWNGDKIDKYRKDIGVIAKTAKEAEEILFKYIRLLGGAGIKND